MLGFIVQTFHSSFLCSIMNGQVMGVRTHNLDFRSDLSVGCNSFFLVFVQISKISFCVLFHVDEELIHTQVIVHS
jgi:hypothetical protein